MAKPQREFGFEPRHFELFRKLLFEQAGISLSNAKEELVYGRLAKRIRKLKLDNFDAYYRRIKKDTDGELRDFVNAMTTNLTAFFREEHHFDTLKKEVLPDLMVKNQVSHRIRIWSAGCSTGEEPYSIAMTVREAIPNIDAWDVKILATDIDTNVLEKAKSGVYDEQRVEGVSKMRLNRWFYKGRNAQSGKVKVKPELQQLITFKQLNLMKEWPFKEHFDVIFCRNVIIYFDKPTQGRLFNRFFDILSEDGFMILGHSETLDSKERRFQLIGKTVHRKCA